MSRSHFILKALSDNAMKHVHKLLDTCFDVYYDYDTLVASHKYLYAIYHHIEGVSNDVFLLDFNETD